MTKIVLQHSAIAFIFLMCWISSCYSHPFDSGFKVVIRNAPSEFAARQDTLISVLDSLDAIKKLEVIITDYHYKGYLEAGFDSVTFNENTCSAFLHKGSQYFWERIIYDDVHEDALRSIRFRPDRFIQQPVNYRAFDKIHRQLVRYYENKGYPFVKVGLDSMIFNNNQVIGKLNIDLNGYFAFDTIIVRGNARISPEYLHQYTGIKKGDAYNERKVFSIERKINEIIYVNPIRPFEIEFRKSKADLYFYLDTRKANQFSGIIGFLPNEQTGRLMLTGNLDLFLVNSFGRGEEIKLNWEKPQELSQNLIAGFTYPFIFNSPLGVEFDFGLRKQDTTYLNLRSSLSIEVFRRNDNLLKLRVSNQQSSLISTIGFENVTVLPHFSDYKITSYGVGYRFRRIDYLYNPSKGLQIQANAMVGNKRILRNSKVNPLVYENVNLTSVQYEGTLTLEYFQPLFGNFVAMIRSNNGYLHNENVFENEMFRLGGAKTLRGFDQDIITASIFSVFTTELRYLYEKNSNVFLFWDGAYYERTLSNSTENDYPWGIGAGININTKAGIFMLSYALGKRFDNPIELKSAKIHLGYINRF